MKSFWNIAKSCARKKPVINRRDLNVAHKEIDLANARGNRGNAGFTDAERNSLIKFLSHGYIDNFPRIYEGSGHYTYWSWINGARARNIGWRIDYFLVTENFLKQIKRSWILSDVLGSDHCPIEIEIK